MSVSEVTQALGSWSVTLRADTPRSILDAIGYYGHVAITTRRSEAAAQGDGLLTSARYVGVVRGITRVDATQPVVLSGSGMGFWLGDENDVGAVYQNPVVLTAASFPASVAALLPASGAVTSGVIGSVGGTITQTFQWTSPRTALTQLCALFTTGTSAATTVEWRVNGNGTADVGPVSGLYVTTPIAALVRRNPGADMTARSLPGVFQNAQDVMNYATGVVLLAAGTSGSTAVGTASRGIIPYRDIHGNLVGLVKMVSQSSTGPTNANAAAADALNASAVNSALVLSTADFDVRGVVAAGDYVWVQDPDSGLVDLTQEVHLRGDVLNPVLLRCVELDWPVTQGMGAAYRNAGGIWTDLTDYLVFESGVTNVVVGALNTPLVSGGEAVGSRPLADASVPGVPVFGAESTSVYLGPSDGKTKAQIQVAWSTPLNTDGSTIIDGDHYEIRYQPDLAAFTTNPTWAALNAAGYTWAALNAAGATWNQVISPAAAQWHTSTVGWGTNSVLIQELTPGVSYNFQIRSVDTASPPNFGAWSATTVYQASVDTIAPPTPDAPTVASGMAAVQVTWDCGTASGGAFTQAVDLNHIEVHASYDPLFAPTSATKLANVQANVGNITGSIAVVATVALPPSLPVAQSVFIKIVAVDNSGNKSLPSASAGVTATLWPNAYISDLSVSKLTAGMITAAVILGSTISTAPSGGRVTLDGAADAFEVYDTTGTLVGSWSPAGFSLFTNPGGGTLSISPNPGTFYSPVITLSAGVGGITSTPGSVHAEASATQEHVVSNGPISVLDATNSFARLSLNSGFSGTAAYGELEIWQNSAAFPGPILSWNSTELVAYQYCSSFGLGANLGGSVIQLDAVAGVGVFTHRGSVGPGQVTDSGGQLVFAHGANFTPTGAFVMYDQTGSGSGPYCAAVFNLGATTFGMHWESNGASYASSALNGFHYEVWA